MKINSFVWWCGDIYQVYGNHCNAIFIGEPFTQVYTIVVPHGDCLEKVRKPAKFAVQLITELRGDGSVLLHKGEEIYSVIREGKTLIIETQYDIYNGHWRDVVGDITIKD